jgi:hypothetical protein
MQHSAIGHDDAKSAVTFREIRIMTILFATLRVALFFVIWGLLLMAVPTILRVL